MQVEQLFHSALFKNMSNSGGSWWDEESEVETPLLEVAAGEFPKCWSSNLIASNDSFEQEYESPRQPIVFEFLNEEYSDNSNNANCDFSKFLAYELQQIAAQSPSFSTSEPSSQQSPDDDIIDIETLPDLDRCESFENLLLLPGQIDFLPNVTDPPAETFIPVGSCVVDDDDILNMPSEDEVL
eukprot:TRINITY_DN19018_c0_g1_i1.p1 TRINITY_DN19018_c0_g1~~TRINITY_DN19018_c0_g1_i1.p1  ORF type:complete len:202 (+),score=53.38 TRINITY_DN19018_c0_g1_i1:59-607(+)